MIIKSFILPPIENNNYLVIDEESKEAVLIDCSSADDDILIELKKHGATLKYVLLTHGHFDHIGGLNELSEGVQVLMHHLFLFCVQLVQLKFVLEEQFCIFH